MPDTSRSERSSPHEQFVRTFEASSDEAKLSILFDLLGMDEGFPLLPLLGLYFREDSVRVQKAMVEYFSRQSDPEAVPLMAQHVGRFKDNPRVNGLLIACWQSPLDFAEHLDVFVSTLMESSYPNALEAFTVIENALPSLSDQQITAYQAQLMASLGGADADGQRLVSAMMDLMGKAKATGLGEVRGTSYS